ncbi:MAG: TonB-dependent receptor [Bacteroidia bacterium]|nr:TonB-dependent receptor [Bacteroidia bacterium]
MNGKQEKRRAVNSKVFFAAALSSLFILGNSYAMADRATHAYLYEVNDQHQSQSLSGTVTDANGEPIIGASVIEKGTTNGIITDLDGKFKLTAKQGATLVISFVGYQTQEVKATKVMRIVLKEDAKVLDEVVVVGYGTQKKANLTGAVSTVDVGKTLDSRPIADVGRGLQGSTPGLSIRIPDAEVGSDPKIKIRGQYGSINGKTDPLILLDNVEIPSITLVNPDDIESISVLKDAAASSIYGAKAAFGVILISTKKGAKQESMNVTYSGNISFQNVAKGYNMGQFESLEYALAATENAGATTTGAFYKVTRENIEKAREWKEKYGGKLGVNDPTVYGRDWYLNAADQKVGLRTYDAYDYMIKEWAPTQSHNLSINGRSGKTTYNVGLGYLDQSGMNKTAKKDAFERYNASIRLSTQFNKYITFNAGAIYSKRTKYHPYITQSVLDQWYYLYRWGPQYPLGYDENNHELRSPASEYHQANTAKQEKNYTNVNLGFHLDLTKNWTVDFDYTHANEEYNWLRPGIRFTAADTWSAPAARVGSDGKPVYVNNEGAVVAEGAPNAMPAYDLVNRTYTSVGSTPDNINRRSTNSQRNTINAYTTYQLNLNSANQFKFMAGMNRVSYVEEYHWGQKAGLMDFENVQFGGASGTQTTDGGKSWESQLGFFGRMNYSLLDKYLFEANLRYDGTSKFSKDQRWSWYPSFSLGWRANEEIFMNWAKPALSSLKFRASWGSIGDQTVSNDLYIPTLGKITQSSWLDESGNKVNMVYAPKATAQNPTWQRIETLDIGFDSRFLNNELGVTFDWYQRDTKDMLVGKEGIPHTYGTKAPVGNYGNLRTNGWELSIDYTHRFANGLGINATVTLADAITKVTKIGSNRKINDWYNGKTYGEIWGYRTDRLYQKEDFEYGPDGKLIVVTLDESHGNKNATLKAYKLKGNNPVYQAYLQSGSFWFQPGDVKFKDVNGDGQITDGEGTVDNPGDKEVIGNSTPRYEYGIRLGADYKGFDLSLFFQGVGKRDMWGSSSTTLPGFNTADGAMAERFCTNYWTEENPNAFYPRAWNQANSTDTYNMRKQDGYLLDMSYLRLKNITAGYTLPMDLTKKVWIQRARFYVSLENYFTWDHLDGTPVDPEIIAGEGLLSSDNYQYGRAGISTPAFKSFSIGVQLNF